MYVFLMDVGRLVALDDILLTQNVSSLRTVLARDFDLSLDKQILLVSGGFQLEPGDKLSTYGAGLDKTNPIYVFTQTSGNIDNARKPDVLHVNDGGYPRQLATLLDAAPSDKVFRERVRLVQALIPIATETANAIEQLVSEQRQMIQGWCVALANLAEVAADVHKRQLFATNRLAQFETSITEWECKINNFVELKRELSAVPLLSQLITSAELITENLDMPTNLYEWICLQLSLTAIGNNTSTGIASNNDTVNTTPTNRSVVINSPHNALFNCIMSNRARTISAGQLGRRSTPSTAAPLLPSNNNNNNRLSFYTSGSQTSLNSLSSTLNTATTGSNLFLNSDNADPNEFAFTDMIKHAQSNLHFLRFGPNASVSHDATSSTTGNSSQLPYVRIQTNKLSSLVALINSFSVSGYDNISNLAESSNNSFVMKTDIHADSGNNSTTHTTTASSSSMCRGDGNNASVTPANDTAPDLQQYNTNLVKNALDSGYFSQRLSELDPLTEQANSLANEILVIQLQTIKFVQSINQNVNATVLLNNYKQNTEQLCELLRMFDHLCEVLDIVVQNKLLLADNLTHRQRWLQNFQSDLNRLDSVIQNCLRRMHRVATTGTLISQLSDAPLAYFRCLLEIVRRREFEDMLSHRSTAFFKEENHLRTKEARWRSVFAKNLKNNVLHSLFTAWTHTANNSLPVLVHRDLDDDVGNYNSYVQNENDVPHSDLTKPSYSIDRGQCRRLLFNASLSESHLHELNKINRPGARAYSPRLNSLNSTDQQLIKVKEEETVDPNSLIPSDMLGRVTTIANTTTATITNNTPANMTARIRRSSIASEPNQYGKQYCPQLIQQSSSNNCITRQDLEKLLHSLPVELSNLCLVEFRKIFPDDTTKSLATVKHIGLTPVALLTEQSTICTTAPPVVSTAAGFTIMPSSSSSLTSPLARVQELSSNQDNADIASDSNVTNDAIIGSASYATCPVDYNQLSVDYPSSSSSGAVITAHNQSGSSVELTSPMIDTSSNSPSRNEHRIDTSDFRNMYKLHRKSISFECLTSAEQKFIHVSTQTDLTLINESNVIPPDLYHINAIPATDDYVSSNTCLITDKMHNTTIDDDNNNNNNNNNNSDKNSSGVMDNSTGQSACSNSDLFIGANSQVSVADDEMDSDTDLITTLMMMTCSFHSTRTTFSDPPSDAVATGNMTNDHRDRRTDEANIDNDGGMLPHPPDSVDAKSCDPNGLSGRQAQICEQQTNSAYERTPHPSFTTSATTMVTTANPVCVICQLENLHKLYFELMEQSCCANQSNLVANGSTDGSNLSPSSSSSGLEQLLKIIKSSLYDILMHFNHTSCPNVTIPIGSNLSEHSETNEALAKDSHQARDVAFIMKNMFNTVQTLMNTHSHDLSTTSCDHASNATSTTITTGATTTTTTTTTTTCDTINKTPITDYNNNVTTADIVQQGELQPEEKELPSSPPTIDTSSPLPSSADNVDGFSYETANFQSMESDNSTYMTASSYISSTDLTRSKQLTFTRLHKATRALQFVHCNFCPNDVVIFVPVRTTYTSQSTIPINPILLDNTLVDSLGSGGDDNFGEKHIPLTPSSPAEVDRYNVRDDSPCGKISSSQAQLDSLSSNLLTSVIVQPSGVNSSNRKCNRSRITDTLLRSHYTPPRSATWKKYASTLFNEQTLFSELGEKQRPTQLTPSTSSLSIPVNNSTTSTMTSKRSAPNSIQWRMLSSDASVYFLHQDDFKLLNINDNIDYCRPSNNNVCINKIKNKASHRLDSMELFQSTTQFPSTNIHQCGAKYFVVAKYLTKERCLSKRAGNRFDLPKNFVFYRVRVLPFNNIDDDDDRISQ